jgi:Holliday junction resolvasome RuvABC endonuclease subunit
MHYIGIDQSFTSTGFVIKDINNTIVKYGTCSSPKSNENDIYKRAWDISQQLKTVFSICETDSIICIEGLSFGGFGSATRDLAGLQFTIINVLRELYSFNNIHVISPTSLKKSALGIGKGGKIDMHNAVPENIKTMFINDKYKKTNGLYDIVDAYWLSTYAYNQFKKETI